MKYYLIIGYQSLEKFRQYTRMQVFLNDIMLEDFDLNSEDSISNIFQNSSITDKTTLADAIHNSKQSKTNLDSINKTLAVQALKKYRIKLQKENKSVDKNIILAEKYLNVKAEILLKQCIEKMDYQEQGLVFKYGNIRSKIRNQKYNSVKMMRGNDPNLFMNYLKLRKENQVMAYLSYFPEHKEQFASFRQH